MAITFANNQPVFEQQPFSERFKDIFRPDLVSPIAGTPQPRGLKQKLIDLFLPTAIMRGGKMFEEKKEEVPIAGTMFKEEPTPSPLENKFRKGFKSYGSPLSTASAEFATQAAKNPLPDPFMPAVIALMETSGGKKQKFSFNPFNWGMQHFPSLPYAIERIYSGISKRFPIYKDYLKSGNLEDLFKHYTPPVGNPSTEELIKRYNQLRKLFD